MSAPPAEGEARLRLEPAPAREGLRLRLRCGSGLHRIAGGVHHGGPVGTEREGASTDREDKEHGGLFYSGRCWCGKGGRQTTPPFASVGELSRSGNWGESGGGLALEEDACGFSTGACGVSQTVSEATISSSLHGVRKGANLCSQPTQRRHDGGQPRSAAKPR